MLVCMRVPIDFQRFSRKPIGNDTTFRWVMLWCGSSYDLGSSKTPVQNPGVFVTFSRTLGSPLLQDPFKGTVRFGK
jgi:hypothetical protein